MSFFFFFNVNSNGNKTNFILFIELHHEIFLMLILGLFLLSDVILFWVISNKCIGFKCYPSKLFLVNITEYFVLAFWNSVLIKCCY